MCFESTGRHFLEDWIVWRWPYGITLAKSACFFFYLFFSLLFSRFRLSVYSYPARKNLPDCMKPNATRTVHFLTKSRADSTVRRYLKEIQKFITCCKSHNFSVKLPFSVSVVSVYMARVYKDSKSYCLFGPCSCSWFHSFIPDDVQNPVDSAICHNVLEAAKRSKPSPIVKKLPISPEIIRKIVTKFASPKANLRDLRLACLCALGFAGVFRYNELSSILPLHVEFRTDFVRIFVPQAKNDAYREGNYVFVKRLNSQFCPVALLDRYILQADIDLNSSLPPFRPLRYYKSTNTYKL